MHEKEEAAIRVLHLFNVVRLPLRFLQDVGNAVSAFWDAKIV